MEVLINGLFIVAARFPVFLNCTNIMPMVVVVVAGFGDVEDLSPGPVVDIQIGGHY